MASPTNLEGTLQRGRACLSCRRRKMRCDGARPFCTQCIRGGRQEDCEYTDNQGRTRTQILEENIASLQARIQELENPTNSAPPVLLHHPYGATRQAQPAHQLNHISFGVQSDNAAPAVISAASLPAALAWWEFEDLPAPISDMLIKEFIPKASSLGFVLNVGRFVESLSRPTLHPSRPHAALLHAIYLWSIHLSGNTEMMAHENVFLQRAVLALQDALGGDSTLDLNVAQKRIHAIQSEVLLSVYFFSLGRYLEGRYHSNAAVSLAVSCGLHHIVVSQQLATSVLSSSTSELGHFALVPASSAVELGERINVFWAVFCLDKFWSVAVGSPSVLVDDSAVGASIDTPWPLDMSDYELFSFLFEINADPASSFMSQGTMTVQSFLAGQLQGDDASGRSVAALYSKACAIMERATRVASAFDIRHLSTQNELSSLSRLITQFARSLIPLDNIQTRVESADQQRALLVVHSLAHDAMIRLYRVRARVAQQGDQRDSNVCLVHAGEILRIMEGLMGQDGDNGILDPVLGPVWMTAAQTFKNELIHSRNANPPASPTRIEALELNLNRMSVVLMKAIEAPIFAFHVTQILEIIRY